MRTSPHSHQSGHPLKKRWTPKTITMAVLAALYVFYLLFLGVSTAVDSIQAARLTTDIEATQQQLDAIYSRNAEFNLYVENKAFMDSLTIPKFSVYLDDLGTKIPEGTRTQSIQISRTTLDKQETYGLNLVLESVPPLREISRVLETLSGSPYFKDVTVASATVNITSSGTSTFSYPISMTLHPNPTNGNSNAQ